MITIKLAEALLRRKELDSKVAILRDIKEKQLIYEVRGQRVKVTDGLEEMNANFPKLNVSEVTAEYDFYARQLRLIDAKIQQTNWTAEVVLDDTVMSDFISK